MITQAEQFYIDTIIEELHELKHSLDTEQDHADADELLCKVLVKLGQKELVNAYRAIHKWYA